MTSALSRRLDRLDHGNWRNRHVEDMTDEQLWQAIASGMPNPANFLERVKGMTDEEEVKLLNRLIAGE